MTNWRDYVPPHRWRACDDPLPHEPHMWESGWDGWICDGIEGECPHTTLPAIPDELVQLSGTSQNMLDSFRLVDQ